MVSLILQVQTEPCHFMTQFFSWNKVPWEGFWSNRWSCVGGDDGPTTEYEAAAEEHTPLGQPLLPQRRREKVRK